MRNSFVLSLIFTLILGVNTLFAQKKQVKGEGILGKHDPRVQKIIKSDEGVIRGIQFYDTRDKIKSIEGGASEAETKASLIYKIPTEDGNYADVIYEFNEKNQLIGISVAFMIKSKNDENSLMKDMMEYYSERYGDYFTDSDGDYFWVAKAGYKVEMNDNSADGQIEIEIEYIPNR